MNTEQENDLRTIRAWVDSSAPYKIDDPPNADKDLAVGYLNTLLNIIDTLKAENEEPRAVT